MSTLLYYIILYYFLQILYIFTYLELEYNFIPIKKDLNQN